MKKILLFLCFLIHQGIFAQINLGAENANLRHPHVAMSIDSEFIGVLLPRLSSAKINQILNPANGLVLIDSTLNRFKFYNQDHWTNFLNNSDFNLFDGRIPTIRNPFDYTGIENPFFTLLDENRYSEAGLSGVRSSFRVFRPGILEQNDQTIGILFGRKDSISNAGIWKYGFLSGQNPKPYQSFGFVGAENLLNIYSDKKISINKTNTSATLEVNGEMKIELANAPNTNDYIAGDAQGNIYYQATDHIKDELEASTNGVWNNQLEIPFENFDLEAPKDFQVLHISPSSASEGIYQNNPLGIRARERLNAYYIRFGSISSPRVYFSGFVFNDISRYNIRFAFDVKNQSSSPFKGWATFHFSIASQLRNRSRSYSDGFGGLNENLNVHPYSIDIPVYINVPGNTERLHFETDWRGFYPRNAAGSKTRTAFNDPFSRETLFPTDAVINYRSGYFYEVYENLDDIFYTRISFPYTNSSIEINNPKIIFVKNPK